MSRNFYSEINLHIVWHTKGSLPLLTHHIEKLAHRYLRKRVIDTSGGYVHEIGGTSTHVHLAVSVPPTLKPSEWIGQLKGGSSHDVNQESVSRDKHLQWQSGYGVVSFGTRDLEWVVAYIRNQEEHHRCARTVDRLERITQSVG